MSNHIKQSGNLHGGKRPGAGRPEVEDKRKPRSIKFSDAEWEAVRGKADAAGKTISDYVRGLALRCGKI